MVFNDKYSYKVTFEEEEEIDIVSLQGEIDDLEKKLKDVRKEMSFYLL